MNADKRRSKLNELTETNIGSADRVFNVLGSGCMEKIYEHALAIKLRKAGLQVAQQQKMRGCYGDAVVGGYTADLFVENSVLAEVKAAKSFDEMHATQCLNYLKATDLNVCPLINFGKPKIEIKHIVNEF